MYHDFVCCLKINHMFQDTFADIDNLSVLSFSTNDSEEIQSTTAHVSKELKAPKQKRYITFMYPQKEVV